MKQGERIPGGARRVILTTLRANPQGLLIPEVMEKANVSRVTAYKYLTGLKEEGYAKRVHAGGAAYRWFHRKVSDEEMAAVPKGKDTRRKATPKFTVAVETTDLYNFLVKWQTKWNPKIFKSARNLPLGLARLYELACEQAYGSVINQNDIDDVRMDIDQLRKDLEQTLRVVNGILDDKRVWHRSTFAQMTLADNDVNEIKSIAFKVKEAN